MWKVFLIGQLAKYVSCTVCFYQQNNWTRIHDCKDGCCSDGTCCDLMTANRTLVIAVAILGGVVLIILIVCLVCCIKMNKNKNHSRRIRPEHIQNDIGVFNIPRNSARFGTDNRRIITFVEPPPYASSPPPYTEEDPVSSSGTGINPVFSNAQQPRSASRSIRTLPNPPPSYSIAISDRARATPYPR